MLVGIGMRMCAKGDGGGSDGDDDVVVLDGDVEVDRCAFESGS